MINAEVSAMEVLLDGYECIVHVYMCIMHGRVNCFHCVHLYVDTVSIVILHC
jgi:hypothetical protein